MWRWKRVMSEYQTNQCYRNQSHTKNYTVTLTPTVKVRTASVEVVSYQIHVQLV